MTATPQLALDLIAEGEGGRLSHNENMRRLDLCVLTKIKGVQTTPPGVPADGDAYIPKSVATGVWAGHENQIAVYWDAAWQFYTPAIGWQAFLSASWPYGSLVYRGTGAGYEGTYWFLGIHTSILADLVVALTDNSGGTSGGDTIAVVTDAASAANAIATLAAKVNSILTELKDAKHMSTT